MVAGDNSSKSNVKSGKRSKAATAAARARGPSSETDDAAVVSGRANKALVERSALVFEHFRSLPPYEDDAIRDGVRAFLRFVEKVETGAVEEDARALADLVVQRGYAWLQDNPGYVPVPTSVWSLAMVEQAIVLFNERTGSVPDARLAEELVADLRTFESVLASGCVEGGDAEHLAQAFVDYAHRWMKQHPAIAKRYQAHV